MIRHLKNFLLYNSTTRQTIAKNTFWLAFSQFGGRLLRSIIIIYAARILGAEGWGAFSYAITLVAFLTLFVDIGINVILTKEIVRGEHSILKKESIISTSFFIKIFLLLIGVCIVVFVAPYFSKLDAAKALFPIVACILVFDTMREFGFSITRALEHMQVEAGLYTLTNISIVVLGFLFLSLAPSVTSFTLAYAIGTAIGMAATFFVLRNDLKNVFSHFRWDYIRPIFSSAWPFAASAALGMFMLNTDILMLGWFRGAEEVGFYSAGNRIVQLLYTIPSILTISVLPTFTRLAFSHREKMRYALENTITTLFLFSIPMGIGGVILGDKIIDLVFGSTYLPATLSFRILMLTLMIDFSALVLSNAVFAFNQQKKLTINTAIGASINVFGDIIFVPLFGMTGSALVTLVAQTASMAYLWHTIYTLLPFSITKKISNILFATIGMSASLLVFLALNIPVIIIIISSVIIYFVLLYARKEPLLREIKHIFLRS
jgi:O-antigen/teichoic acid export membrane protein